ncbi:MAG: hypothetical protein QUS11_06535 [Candidatus Fermentibacter sp.]|nr:hypothetical protein [Candidatus Fermentibacter sp.]
MANHLPGASVTINGTVQIDTTAPIPVGLTESSSPDRHGAREHLPHGGGDLT